MTSTVTRAAEVVSTNILLAAVTRLGVPLLLAGMLWLVSTVNDGDKRASLIEAKIASVEARVSAVEARVAEDGKSSAQMRSDIASLLATSAATLRAVERLERLQERPAAR
ncbi:hypothetical protein HMPREF9946_00107 [Acetobacteraceae bacterium AT-5844]|nr:hypothetical protein HMPREF9946_00107 [Acetobacteraceae bacterium AT-5844]